MLRFKRKDSPNAKPLDGSLLTQSRDYLAHPLASTDAVTIEMEYDDDAESFVTFVKELHGMSTFADTEFDALEMTAEMIRGYVLSMEERGMKIPIGRVKLAELKRIVGL